MRAHQWVLLRANPAPDGVVQSRLRGANGHARVCSTSRGGIDMAAGSGAGTTSCPECHKRYPWRDSLEGKKVKCKCGNVFEAALDLEGALPDHDDRTYDVAEDYVAPREPMAVSTTAPILPEAPAGNIANAYPQRNKKVLTYAHANPAEAAEIRERSVPRARYLPVGSLAGGVVVYGAAVR